MPGYRDRYGNYHASTDTSRAGYDQLKHEIDDQRGRVELDYQTERSMRSLYGSAWVDEVQNRR